MSITDYLLSPRWGLQGQLGGILGWTTLHAMRKSEGGATLSLTKINFSIYERYIRHKDQLGANFDIWMFDNWV